MCLGRPLAVVGTVIALLACNGAIISGAAPSNFDPAGQWHVTAPGVADSTPQTDTFIKTGPNTYTVTNGLGNSAPNTVVSGDSATAHWDTGSNGYGISIYHFETHPDGPATFTGTYRGYYNDGSPFTPLYPQEGVSLSTPVSLSVAVSLAKTTLGVGDQEDVSANVSATGGDVTGITLGKGLVSSSDALVVSQSPSGLSGFDLSDGSTKSFTFTVKAVKAGSVTLSLSASGTESDGSMIDSNPASAQLTINGNQFDYEMPSRWDLTGELDGKSSDKVYNPSEWPVLFTISPDSCNATAVYSWYVDGRHVEDKPGQEACTFWVDFPKLGVYMVNFRQQITGSPSTDSDVQKVIVQDFVIASIGDSMASGEGDPPYTTTGANADIGCHRSNDAYTAVASKQIEDDDPHSSVTFIPLACSGTTLAGKYTYGTIKYQLAKLSDVIGNRQISTLTISVGINDLDFAYVLWSCWKEYRCQDQTFDADDEATLPNFINMIKGIKSRKLSAAEYQLFMELSYSNLEDDIRDEFSTTQLKSSDIYLVDYIDPLYESPGKLCPVVIPGLTKKLGGFENIDGQGEVYFAQDQIVEPLEHKESGAAESYGWHFVQLPASVVQSHGYCSTDSWFNNIEETGRQFTKALSVNGIFHPKPVAQEAVADELLKYLKPALLPDGKPRAPR